MLLKTLEVQGCRCYLSNRCYLSKFYFLTAGTIGIVENEMDGEAVTTLLAAVQGPDCLRDLVPKLGVRLKVYQRIKMFNDQELCFY